MLSENRRQRDFSILPVKSEKTGRKRLESIYRTIRGKKRFP